MNRITKIYRPEDYPGQPDQATQQELNTLFETLCPGSPDPEIDKNHDGVAIAAHNPGLALRLAQLSGFMSLQMPWSRRADLRDLTVQTVNTYYKCQYSFDTRKAGAEAAGISTAQQLAIGQWHTSELFDDEQRLVIEYTDAVLKGEVTDELSTRVTAAFGEKGTVEFTALIGLFAAWAMILKATRSD